MRNTKNSKTAVLHRIRISKKRFDSIPETERLLFIRFGHLLDEINSLLRLFLWSMNFANIENEELAARTAQGLVIARVLIGKLNECYEVIKKHYNRGIAKKYSPLMSAQATKAYSELKRYFSNSNIINTVRKRYAFHYSHDELAELLTTISPEDDLVFYLSADSRNRFYSSADKIINDSMLEAIKPGNPDEAQKSLQEESMRISKFFIIFLEWYLDSIMREYFGTSLKEMGAEEIRIQKAPRWTEIEIPYFLYLEDGD